MSMTLNALQKKHAAAVKALLPHANADAADWKAMKFSEDEAMLCTPVYKHDLRRRHMVGNIRIDGLTKEEAQERSMAVAEFLVDAANFVIDSLRERDGQ